MHFDNNKKDILILGKAPTDGLNDTTLTAEKRYSINFNDQQKIFCLSLHWNGVNSYIFVNGVEIYKIKAKDSKINKAPLCSGNVSKDFLGDCNNIVVDGVLDIHKYLMEKHDIK